MPVRGIVDAHFVISDFNLKIEKTCTDLGLILDKYLKWHNHIENRFMKTLNVFEMIRRNTSQNVNIKSKINIYKSLLIYILPYSSECYWPSRSDMRQSNTMNKWITNRILPVENYKERLLQLELLPDLYYQEIVFIERTSFTF